MVTKRQNRTKDHSVSAIFLIFSTFTNRSQISLFSRKACDKLITMTAEKGGVPVLVGELWPFFNWQSSISRQIRHVFNVQAHERLLNDSINYAQKGCATQIWGITLNTLSIVWIEKKMSRAWDLVLSGWESEVWKIRVLEDMQSMGRK